MNESKFCVNCRHYCERIGWHPDECNHPDNVKVDLVTGNPGNVKSPTFLRSANGLCGADGLMFEVKAP